MKKEQIWSILVMLILSISTSVTLSACSDDDEPANAEHDTSLYGEWVESSGNRYVFDYYHFYSDGTGIHGSYESDIDWVNEDDDIKWYTVDKKYLYIDGAQYEYSCDGSSLEIKMNGKTRRYHEK